MKTKTKVKVTVCQILDEVMGQYYEDYPSDDYKIAQLIHSIIGWSPKCTHGDKCKAYKVVPKPRLLGGTKRAAVKYSGFAIFAESMGLHPQPIIVRFDKIPKIFVDVYSKDNMADAEKVSDLLKERLGKEISPLEVIVEKKYLP